MPKKTYFDLPEEKKDRIRQAVYEEYTTKEYKDVTTRSLTQRAGIPMGSLYQYFENKDEVYIYHYMELEYKSKDLLYHKIFDFSESIDIEFLFNTDYKKLNILTPMEISFSETISKVPDNIHKKMLFDDYDSLRNDYLDNFKRIIKQYAKDKNIENSKYFDFLMYIYMTIPFNVVMYFKKNNINGDEQLPYLNYLYKDIILNGLHN